MIIDTGNKYIHFELKYQLGKTQVWSVVNKSSGITLADIRWYGPWRQYVFTPVEGIGSFYNTGCLKSIEEFMARLNMEKSIVA